MDKLNGKTAIITGGSGGIGKVTAEKFLKQGANVVLVDMDEEGLSKTKKDLKQHGNVLTIQADVSKEEDVKNYVKETTNKFGRIDILFNNAGVEGDFGNITDQKMDNFNKVMSINLGGVFLGLKHVLPVMEKQQNGSIINTSSVAGLEGSPGLSPYTASKHGITGLTKVAALEAADNNVRVNSVHPAPANTRMMRGIESGASPDDPESVKKEYTSAIPLGRYAEAIDIANLVLFLASDDSSFITGAQYRIDGGMGAS